MNPPVRIVALLALAACGGGCEMLTSDAATRIAYAARDGAARLQRSSSETLVLSVDWRSWPEGCPAGYRVEWAADTDQPPELGVACEQPGRRGYSTTSYRSFVKVPARLEVAKKRGEPVTIGLRKSGGAIEVVALR
jgi:hypothetical protein